MRKRTNFLPTLLLTLLFLLVLVYLVMFVSPTSLTIVFIFYLVLFLFLFFLFSLLFFNSRRGFIVSCGLIGLTLLQQLKFANLLNVFLVLALVIAAEVFFDKQK